MATTSSAAPARVGTAGRLAVTVGVATLIATAAALVLYAVAWLTGARLVVAPPGQPTGTVNAVSVVVITLVSGLGALVVALLLHRLANARVVFLVVALVVLAVSFAGPLGAADRTSTAVWLSLMHIVVAAIIIPLTLRALPPRRS
jgi:Family of unknown function (DUF6069)